MRSNAQMTPLRPPAYVHHTNNLTARYDKAASAWPRLMRRLGMVEAYRQLFNHLDQTGWFHNLPPNGHILDNGLGAGDLSLALTAVYPHPLKIHGVDISSRMLQMAQSRLAAAGQNGRFYCQDVGQMHWPDNRFSMVMSAHMLEHLDHPGQMVKRWVRAAQPGAPILIVVTQPGIWGEWIKWRWEVSPISEGQLRSWFREAGGTNIDVFPLPGRMWHRHFSLAAIARK